MLSPTSLSTTVAAFAILLTVAAPAAVRAQQANVPPINLADRASVLSHYRNDYLRSQGLDPHWTGSVAGGVAGSLDERYLGATLRRINYFRAMSGLRGDVSLDPAVNAKCQQAALMIAAARNVSHDPPRYWRFYTADAADAASHSALSMDTWGDEGPGAIDRYIADTGANNAFVGHRRWLLYQGTSVMGVGAIPAAAGVHPGANATWVKNDEQGAEPRGRAATAWPPAGYVPAPLVYNRWSFSYPDADFTRATVSVTKAGMSLDVVRERLGYESRESGLGSSVGNNTLAWTLPGNSVSARVDEIYQVRVSNVVVAGRARQFDYPVISINALDCTRQLAALPALPLAMTLGFSFAQPGIVR